MVYYIMMCILSFCFLGSISEAWAKDFRVAIDIGHSPSTVGAVSARGVPEYNFNRKMAQLLLAKLQQDNRFRGSFIVNETGDDLSLSSRPAIAERRGADLFLSIHHDSVYPEQLSQWVYQGKLMDVCDQFAGTFDILLGKKRPSGGKLSLGQYHRDGDAAGRLFPQLKSCQPGQQGTG